MKDPIKNVELSFSCPEKFENMKDVGGNKFCDKCQHLVVDFTKLTQKQFDDAVRNSPGRLCGRFKQSQMSPRFLRYAAVTAVTTAILAPTSCMPEDALPSEDQIPPSPQEQLNHRESYTTGVIVFIPDTINHLSDTTAADEPIYEELEVTQDGKVETR